MIKLLKLKVTLGKRFELLTIEDAHDSERMLTVSQFNYEATHNGTFITLKIPVTPQTVEMQIDKE